MRNTLAVALRVLQQFRHDPRTVVALVAAPVVVLWLLSQILGEPGPFGPVFIGVFTFVFVFITSGMSLVTERSGGTMERLLVSPIKPWQLVAGYCLGFGVAALLQSALVLWGAVTLLDFPNEGSPLLMIAITFSMAWASMTLGLLASALAKNSFQVIQLVILFVVPQVLLSGVLPLDNTANWLQTLSEWFPVRHGAAALSDVMLRGSGFADVGYDFCILWAFIAAFFALAALSFARRRTR
ncbi:MAG: ABC transporter permease [Propionibacteriaceae bacterium]|jgi:ABC-2 type transport system permease protein|nr:ABC transporter permease [Propionibacteriaceae bacterium]